MNLSGSRTLLTGASGGLGEAIARACAERGAQLILTGRRAEVLYQLASELDAEVFVADLASRIEVDRVLGEVGEVDVLVSNAALPAAGEVQSFSVAELDRALEVNLRAPMVLSRVLGAGMASRGRGHLVFISSLAAAFPTPGLTVYNASKAALSTYGLSLRGELKPHGVGVSVIHPGPISEAGMWASTGVSPPAGLRTRSPRQVGSAVVRAIEQDRTQIEVAPRELSVGAFFARAAPGVFVRVAPHLGASAVTASMARALQDRR
jgi:short-subunit dehydrogenase